MTKKLKIGSLRTVILPQVRVTPEEKERIVKRIEELKSEGIKGFSDYQRYCINLDFERRGEDEVD